MEGVQANAFQKDFSDGKRPYESATLQYAPKRGFARYGNATKHLIPFRFKKQNKKVTGIDNAGLFSLVTFSWMSKFVYRAYKKGLTVGDIPECSPYDSCDLNSQRLERLWQREVSLKGCKASFGTALWKFVRTRVLIGGLLYSVSCLLGFLSTTIFMRKLLEYLENPDETEVNGIIWAIGLIGTEILRIMFFALYYSMSYRTGSRLRSACLMLVYKKVLRLNSGNTSAGEIINLFSFDGSRLFYMIVFGPMAIGGPIISVCGLFYIYYILGPWALLGMLIFVIYYPIQYTFSHFTGYYRGRAVVMTDKRIKIMSEILSSIKLIKMYAWENWFSSQIHEVREKELAEEGKISYLQIIGISLAPTIPVISGVATFLIHVATGGNLLASQTFSVFVFLTKQMKTSIQVIRDGSLSTYEGLISVQRFKAYPILAILVNQLRKELLNSRYGTNNFNEGRVLFNRFQKLLLLEENTTRFSREPDERLAFSIKDGHFVWDGTAPPSAAAKASPKETEKLLQEKSEQVGVLRSINMSVPKGALIGICGPVGAGKSSLLLACLGQLKMVSGQISRSGSYAYVSQQSWVENASLKDNILFGEKFDPNKYLDVLRACSLNEDISLFPSGDETEVGERGVNLSGGQKQRLSLARALYSDKEVYLLDDPLSAVDPQVALGIFQKYILEALAKKTVILVTRDVQWLQKCDEILIMKGGQIVERGTYSSLASEGKVLNYHEKNERSENPGDFKPHEKGAKQSPFKKLIQPEQQLRGSVKPYAYRAYVMACGGYVVCFMVIFVIFLNVSCNVFSSWWLAIWIKAGSGNATVFDPATNRTVTSSNINDNPELPFYMQVYGSTVGLIIATCIVRGLVHTKVAIRASRVLHRNLFRSVLYSPLSYFESTPVGRIQSLFSRDLNEVDSRLPEGVQVMLQNIWSVLFSFLSITLVFHWFLVPMTVIVCAYYFISKIFRVAIRDLKRIESISRAPVLSSVAATVSGLPIIRAFNKEQLYTNRFCEVLDENATAVYLSSNAMRWMAVRLDSISVVITLVTSLLVIILKNEVAPAFAGLALTYASRICGVFQYTIRLVTENEARFISIERIQNLIEKLKPERNSVGETKVPQKWPSLGEIKFDAVSLSYYETSLIALKDISFTISGGEKIGVVGRTGAGKSSLAVALFRLVELTSGCILIDGVNIAGIPLPVLRRHLSIVPQDPTLFSDTLRSNLDPFKEFEDDKIWEVLRKTKLATKVKSLPNLMETQVGDDRNLSVGEKQLLCLARTLLRGTKILILDEATASIDSDTENTVQMAIQEEFRGCTVITIAHRLSTVINCDRILVLDQGRIAEFAAPKVLMNNPNSQFAKMLSAANMQ